MKHFATEFLEEQVLSLNDVVFEIRLQQLYDQISHLAGEAMMEEVNQRLKQRFIIAPVVALFAKGFTDDLLYKLTAHFLSPSLCEHLLRCRP